jgi:hypothetical protein
MYAAADRLRPPSPANGETSTTTTQPTTIETRAMPAGMIAPSSSTSRPSPTGGLTAGPDIDCGDARPKAGNTRQNTVLTGPTPSGMYWPDDRSLASYYAAGLVQSAIKLALRVVQLNAVHGRRCAQNLYYEFVVQVRQVPTSVEAATGDSATDRSPLSLRTVARPPRGQVRRRPVPSRGRVATRCVKPRVDSPR